MSLTSNTLAEYISEYSNLNGKMTDFFTLEWLNNGDKNWYKVIEENAIVRHTDFINEIRIKVRLSSDELRKYRCNAHRLANDLYGTTELWFLIVHANEWMSEAEFTQNEIYIYRPDQLVGKLSEILLVEREYLKATKTTAAKDQKSIKYIYGE